MQRLTHRAAKGQFGNAKERGILWNFFISVLATQR